MEDVIIRGGQVVTPDAVFAADVAIADGQIAAIGPDLSGPAREEIDARGLLVFPGVIDIHVHFNEPGRVEWEGLWHGSRAFAAGGGVLFADMPLNSVPPVIDRDAFEQKRRSAERQTLVDFALWGGLVPGNLRELPHLAAAGVIGFKAFMADSGVPEFPAADDYTLLEGMRLAAELRLPVAVHAENAVLVRQLAEDARRSGRISPRDYARSRPVIAEVEAIQRALCFAAETGCALHIVHVSTARGIALALAAREQGVDVSVETCPHYLVFTEDDLERLGALVKCAPPLRSRVEQERLWAALQRGEIDLVASDHSPAPPALKEADDFFAAWGGIAGVQSTLPVLLTEGVAARGLSLSLLARVLADRPAERFRLGRRGRLTEGATADLVLVEPDTSWTLTPDHLHTRYRLSPYVGYTFRGRVRRTIVRGQTVYCDGQFDERVRGQLVRPQEEGEHGAP
jgi:allantoinase